VASVYGRKLPILREEAERMLREVLDPEGSSSAEMGGGSDRAVGRG